MSVAAVAVRTGAVRTKLAENTMSACMRFSTAFRRATVQS